METGLSEKSRQRVSDGLATLLADTYAVYLKTQNFHWNVIGAEFYSLHLLLEKQYQELAEALDEIAERIRSLGFFVDASFAGFKNLSAIADEQKVRNAKEMLHELIKGHEVIIRHMRNLSEVAEQENDGGSVDMLGRRLAVHEKFCWMLRSQS